MSMIANKTNAKERNIVKKLAMEGSEIQAQKQFKRDSCFLHKTINNNNYFIHSQRATLEKC